MLLPKLAWVLGPLVLYALFCAVLAARGRAPTRMALNVHSSLLLLAYLACTAGLGIFWVANQQLPVFDWHYLFGYATLLLVALHLVFNLPLVLRWLGRRARAPSAAATSSASASAHPAGQAQAQRQRGGAMLARVAALALALGLAFYIGLRQANTAASLHFAAAADHPVAQYHAFASESRASVFRRAPGVAWGGAPPAFKHYPGAPTVALARGEPGTFSLGDALARVAPAARLDLAALGRMLYLSAGITVRRGGHALRAAPSSGALFPSELYVAARQVAGLDSGVYHYDPQQHRLVLLGPLPTAGALPGADDAAAQLILTAVFRRTGYKYHNRAYRYALADAGHLLENARLAAREAGFAGTLAPRFDEALAARALGVDGVEEGVLAIMSLGQSAVAGIAAPLPVLDEQEFAPLPAQADTSIGVTGVVHQLTSLRSLSTPAAAAAAAANIVALPPALPATRSLFSTIVQRRSVRRYAPDALGLAQLSSQLADLRQPPALYGAIRISVVVNRVAGLAPGVYRYLPQHALQRVRAGQFGATAQAAALAQDAIGEAAAVLVLSSPRASVLAGGARGYRHALLESGLIGERWLLGATARGLAACPVGAFYDDEAAALIGVDPSQHWVFHFAALGIPAGA